MLAELEEIAVEEPEEREMPALNHSFICAAILELLLENKTIRALPELTLNIGNGITPDISVCQRDKIKPDFVQDFPKYAEMPLLAIEVISASQNIQDLLDKSKMLVANGVIESEGVRVDFQRIFS